MSKKVGWYHETNFEGTTSIESFEEAPSPTHDSVWWGPFKSFGSAKKDALEYHRATKATVEMAIKEVKAIRKKNIYG